jgi:hypothetical protein
MKPFRKATKAGFIGMLTLDKVSMFYTSTDERQTMLDHVGHSNPVWQGQIRIA